MDMVSPFVSGSTAYLAPHQNEPRIDAIDGVKGVLRSLLALGRPHTCSVSKGMPVLSAPKRSLSLRIPSSCRQRSFEPQLLKIGRKISHVRQRIAKCIGV